jgi:hypothetical protein
MDDDEGIYDIDGVLWYWKGGWKHNIKTLPVRLVIGVPLLVVFTCMGTLGEIVGFVERCRPIKKRIEGD